MPSICFQNVGEKRKSQYFKAKFKNDEMHNAWSVNQIQFYSIDALKALHFLITNR